MCTPVKGSDSTARIFLVEYSVLQRAGRAPVLGHGSYSLRRHFFTVGSSLRHSWTSKYQTTEGTQPELTAALKANKFDITYDQLTSRRQLLKFTIFYLFFYLRQQEQHKGIRKSRGGKRPTLTALPEKA